MNTNGHNTNGDGTGGDSALAYTANEAARSIRVSRSKFYELVREEGVPYVLVGNKKRFPVDLLRKWLEQRAHSGPETERN